jgi:DNA-3-methyladenine glycosylase II
VRAVERLTIRAKAPYDFDLSARIFSDGDPQIRTYKDSRFWQGLRINHKLMLATVKAAGTVEQPALFVELRSDRDISESDKRKAQEVIRLIFNPELDLTQFYRQVKEDQTMTMVTRSLRGLKGPTTSTVFEALVDSIVEQQISLNVAQALETKLIKAFGDSVELDSRKYYAYPTPKKLARAAVKKLRRCGLSMRKAEYIKGISSLIVRDELNLEKFRAYENAEQIIEELDAVRGIGVWTAEMTMIRGMQRFDALPADDLGLRRVIAHFYCGDNKISSEEVRRIAEEWGKWKGLAAFYLVMAEWMENSHSDAIESQKSAR